MQIFNNVDATSKPMCDRLLKKLTGDWTTDPNGDLVMKPHLRYVDNYGRCIISDFEVDVADIAIKKFEQAVNNSSDQLGVQMALAQILLDLNACQIQHYIFSILFIAKVDLTPEIIDEIEFFDYYLVMEDEVPFLVPQELFVVIGNSL